MKKTVLLLLVLIIATTCFTQIKSPEEFLGYKIGSRYTPHYQLVNYFKYVAERVPATVSLKQYGETNEHRPLYVSFVSTAENISNLENIRLNNLRLANLAKDKMMPVENTPAIVWLSYNVHGNETSSSEAAMLTLFSLVEPGNANTKEWLKNTIIIIDPCLNPDGRDRYVNWFNSMVGNNYDPAKYAREHDEPWPGGRTNHYNFDLNRDWAWQTQVESRERLALYNQWMPEVHVDFHEQSYNRPYYFAPAAEPYQEVITKWQRDFQVVIGKNNAKYFDKNGWLYFTKERYDLLYPSYGDTYPIYSGAIGMTFEQGGGSGAGLGVENESGDTVTLYQRVLHHYTTGISTIEMSSLHAAELVKQFHSFFNEAVSGAIGDYKTYVVKNSEQDVERIQSLRELLDKNNIQYGTASGNAKGYNYFTKKEESFSIAKGDLVISSSQPRAALLKVLFEPKTKLADSVTYDITAWAIPYAYGLKTYATQQAIAPSAPDKLPGFTLNSGLDGYGYVIRWQGMSSAKTIAQLLKKDIRLHFAKEPFTSGGNSFERGSVIILKNGNEKFGNGFWQTVSDICNANKTTLIPVVSGMVDKGLDFGSPSVSIMKKVTVAMLTGEDVASTAAGEVWNFFDNELKYKITLINAGDFANANWDDIDVLILPDGNYKFLKDKNPAIQLEEWIKNGGKVVALEGAVAQLSKQSWSAIHSKYDSTAKDTAKKDPYNFLKSYEGRERNSLSANTPGAIYKVDIDNTHPLMFGYPDNYYTLKMDTAVYKFIEKGGWNTGVIKKESQMAGFVGYKLAPKLSDGLLFGVQDLGRGNIVYLTDDLLFRDFWENGKLMFCNAVFFVGE